MSTYVFRSLEEAHGRIGPCAWTIGNFDGVHLGHQALISETRRYSAAHALRSAVMTFDPHPTLVVAPERTPQLLCTLEQRIRYIEAMGVDHILVLPFTIEVARLSAREFVEDILCKTLETRAVFVGENFRFGHKQQGTPQTLKTLSREFGFHSQTVAAVSYHCEIISSSTVRRYLLAGNVARAGRLLGRCFSIEGAVIRGHGVGGRQTVPTLNLEPAARQLIPRGVYITETLEASTSRRWNSITNCGFRPTFQGDQLSIETFLLTPLEGSPPSQIEVRFRRFVREERAFPNPDALKEQIFKDVSRARAYWRRVPAFRNALLRYTER
jgi:riboflavin kinase/FMN adenylyltransferase